MTDLSKTAAKKKMAKRTPHELKKPLIQGGDELQPGKKVHLTARQVKKFEKSGVI